jgi:hypothetical protein
VSGWLCGTAGVSRGVTRGGHDWELLQVKRIGVAMRQAVERRVARHRGGEGAPAGQACLRHWISQSRLEVDVVTASSADYSDRRAQSVVPADDLFQGSAPVQSAENLAADGVFDDGELAEFLADLAAMRRGRPGVSTRRIISTPTSRR